MKKFLSVLLATAFLLSLCACAHPNVIATAAPTYETAAPVQTIVSTHETTTAVEPGTSFAYDQLEYTDFLFCSGAGAWSTTLYIESDGHFSGVYQDSDMGDNDQAYPHGTVHYCAFSGQLGTPEPVSIHAFRLPILTLQYSHTPDTQEVKDLQRYCYTTAFGLEHTRELLLYLPGTPMEQLPLEYRQWVGFSGTAQEQALPFYGLYNASEQCGFSSSHRIQSMRSRVQHTEDADAAIQASVTEYATQADMNIAAQQRYALWDDLLNALWALLKQVRDPDTMAQLTQEQLSWIQEKEHAASNAAAEYQGGSLAPLAFSATAANMTRDRVYYLISYLPD